MGITTFPITEEAYRTTVKMELSPESLQQWTDLSGSPMATTGCCSLDGESLSISLAALDLDTSPPVGLLDSVVHTDDVDLENDDTVAYVYFDREASTQLFTSKDGGRQLYNFRPVRSRAVRCDRVVYAQTVSNYGACGHRYSLTFRGRPTATIEAFETIGCVVDQILVTHAAHSPLGVMASLIDKSSFLQYCTPSGHIAKLRRLVDDIRDDEVYLPLNECILGRALESVVLDISDERAKRVWGSVLVSLQSVSDLASRGIVSHNLRELRRVSGKGALGGI